MSKASRAAERARISKILGPAVRQAREKAELSQSILADAIEVTQAEISRIEDSKRMPRFDTMAKIAATIRCSLDRLARECGLMSKPAVARKPRKKHKRLGGALG